MGSPIFIWSRESGKELREVEMAGWHFEVSGCLTDLELPGGSINRGALPALPARLPEPHLFLLGCWRERQVERASLKWAAPPAARRDGMSSSFHLSTCLSVHPHRRGAPVSRLLSSRGGRRVQMTVDTLLVSVGHRGFLVYWIPRCSSQLS